MKLKNLIVGVACALLAGTVVAADDPAWWLIAPDGSSTNEYSQLNEAVQAAKSGSTILLTRDLTLFGAQNVTIQGAKTVAIDLNGHSFGPFHPDGWTVTFKLDGSANAVLSIANGKLSGDVKFVTQETMEATGCVVLGSGLISDGNIYAGKGYFANHCVKVVLTRGFESTYMNGVFNTEAPLLALEGAKFAYPHNPIDVTLPGKLVFPNPYLRLVEQEDFTYEVVPYECGTGEAVAVVEDEKLGQRRFKSLAAAVALTDYGSTIIIVGDVTGENVKIPSGMTVRIGPGGEFREPTAEDLLYDYYMVKTNFAGALVGYEYMLDAEKVTPRVGADSLRGTPWLEFVADKESGLVTSALINIVNAYEGLYYRVDSGLSPTNLNHATPWIPAKERGSLRLKVPAGPNGYFYRVRATDHIEGQLW